MSQRPRGAIRMTIECAKGKMMRKVEELEERFGKRSGAEDILLVEKAMEAIDGICSDADSLPSSRNEILGRLDMLVTGLRPALKAASNRHKHARRQTNAEDQLVLLL